MKQLLFVLLAVSVGCMQSSGQSKIKFHSQNYIGLITGGAPGNYFQIQSVNGFQRQTWFGGIGTGLDYYYFRSVPLFLSVNKYLCSCDRSLYVSADGGLNWIWDYSRGNWANNHMPGDFSPGAYLGLGVGYKIGLKNKRDAVLMNLGYSYKSLSEKYDSSNGDCNGPCDLYSQKIRYKFNRLSLRLGWRF